MRRAKLCSK